MKNFPMLNRLQKLLVCRRGASAVEFAILINVFAAILLGMIAIGYVFMVKADIQKAMAAGERFALITLETDTELKDKIKEGVATYDPTQISISITRGSTMGVDSVEVNFSYTVDIGVSSIFGPITINGSRTFPT